MTLVEHVARAICEAEHGDTGPNGCRECQMEYLMANAAERRGCADRFGSHARAALEAMRGRMTEIHARHAADPDAGIIAWVRLDEEISSALSSLKEEGDE